MRLYVIRISIVDIICRHKADPCLLTHPQQSLIYHGLLGNPMILKLQEEVAFAENFLIAKGSFLALLIHAPENIS